MKLKGLLLVPATIIICGAFFCKPGGPVEPVETHPWCSKSDAITSASFYQSLKVDSVLIFDTCAIVYWWEKYDNYRVVAYRIEYGTDSTKYTDTLKFNITTEKASWSATLHPLIPNTTYFARFYRDYSGEISKTSLHPFTTCAPK